MCVYVCVCVCVCDVWHAFVYVCVFVSLFSHLSAIVQGKILVGTQSSEILEIDQATSAVQVIIDH